MVKDLKKEFRVTTRESGISAALRSLIRPQKKTITAVNGISFSVHDNTITGFIGKNGAGKTTTIKMLTGTLFPTSGEVRVLGFVPQERKLVFRKEISVVMGNKPQIMLDLTPKDYFELIQVMYDVDKVAFETNVAEMCSLLNVSDRIDVQARKLSLGERMKVEFVAAVATEPKLLFLDEPTIGLDVLAKRDIRKFLNSLVSKKDITILLTSHDMDDIAALCNQIILIDNGQIIWDGTVSELTDRFSGFQYVQFQKGTGYDPRLLSGKVVDVDDSSITLKVPRDDVERLLTLLSKEKIGTNFSIHDLQLNDIILEIFEK